MTERAVGVVLSKPWAAAEARDWIDWTVNALEPSSRETAIQMARRAEERILRYIMMKIFFWVVKSTIPS